MPKVIDNYVLQDKIGHGQFGDVYSGFNQDTKMQVAIKTIKRQTIKGKFYQLLENQIKVLKTCDNPHIMKLYALKKTANHYYLILEYCNGGDMLGRLKQMKRIPELEAIKHLCQILTGFQTLVKHKIMHRDFKLPNILLHDGNIKIADFGFAKLLSKDDYATTMLGSPLNMAPEVLGGNRYNSKADIWSIGACLYEMLFGKPPYTAGNMVDLLKNINTKPLAFPSDVKINPTLKDVLKKMLVVDNKRRISWNDLFSHPINRYLDGLVRNQIDLELIQDESLMINTSKYYLKKNLVISHPDDIEQKAKMNDELVGIIESGEKSSGGKKVAMEEKQQQGLKYKKRKTQTPETIQEQDDNYTEKSTPAKEQKQETAAVLTNNKKMEKEEEKKKKEDLPLQATSAKQKFKQSQQNVQRSRSPANYSHIYRKNSKKLLFYRNIYAFLASMVDQTIQLDEQGGQIAAYLMIKEILKTISWLKQSLQCQTCPQDIKGLQRWEQYRHQSGEYNEVKEYIQREQNVFTVFGNSLEADVKEKCLKGGLEGKNSTSSSYNNEVRKLLISTKETTQKEYQKYLNEYIRLLTRKTVKKALADKDFNTQRKYFKHISQMLVCLNYKNIMGLSIDSSECKISQSPQQQQFDFNKLYSQADEATAEELLLMIQQRLSLVS